MKSFRPLLLALLAAALTVSVSAASVIKTVETARIAYVDSRLFLDPSAGIKKLVKANQALELEFSATQGELSLLSEKLRTLGGELQKLSADATTNAKAIADKQAQGERMQREFEMKQQAAQASYNKRAQETQTPIVTEIGTEMRAFAKERDVSLLFDMAKLGEAILDAKPELDLTTDFVAFYNAKHP